jgi:hypothetical protein
MDTTSVAYVLCRIEDDASLTPVSGHQDIVDGVIVAAPKVGSYEERPCMRCFEGRVYDIQRGGWWLASGARALEDGLWFTSTLS